MLVHTVLLQTLSITLTSMLSFYSKALGAPWPTNTFRWIPTIASPYSKRSSTPRTKSDGNIFCKANLANTGLRFRDSTFYSR